MSGRTKIEWADAVWNPVTGCTKVSEACCNCYAERQAKRFAGRAGYPAKHPFAVTLRPDRLNEPLRWRKPRRIFVCSMGDLFHPDVPEEFVDQVWGAMILAPWHQFLVLTKRPERAESYLTRQFKRGSVSGRLCAFYFGTLGRSSVWPLTAERAAAAARWPVPNVWLGTSVEDQATADERIPHLLRCPAVLRFVSYEPALGPVDFGDNLVYICGPTCTEAGFGINWVIAAGESGPKARPAHPDWFRSVRGQCQAAGVPFFFKQWGEWVVPNATVREMDFVPKFKTGREQLFEDGPIAMRVGKKAAGRRLDGVEHNAYPGGVAP